MRRFGLLLLTTLASGCATVPLQDEDRIERAMSGDPYRPDLAIAFVGAAPRSSPGAFFSESYSFRSTFLRGAFHGGRRFRR